MKLFLQREDSRGPERPGNGTFAVLYDFQRTDPMVKLQHPAELTDYEPHRQAQSDLLFLRGYPSPEWLSAVGSRVDVDIEFLEHHLQLYAKQPVQLARTWPPVASQAVMEPRLRLTTLGYLLDSDESTRSSVSHVQKLRQRTRGLFGSYLDSIRNDEVGLGDSLLHSICVHDGTNFSFGQDISICVKQTEIGWFALIWLDFGSHNLADGPKGRHLLAPLGSNPANTIFRPTVFGRACEARDGTPTRGSTDDPNISAECIDQNAMHLWRNYDYGLYINLARSSSLHAPSKLFAFAAASGSQFLNLIQRLVDDEVRLADAFEPENASMSNLLHHQQVLNERRRRLKGGPLALEEQSSWPHALSVTQTELHMTGHTQSKLYRDFDGLIRAAQDIADECNRGARNVIQLASHAESQKAIAQAEDLGRLTRLATIFVPLTLIAAFFGMDSSLFGQGTLPIWVFFAAAGPTLVLSVLLLMPRWRQRLTSWFWPSIRRRTTHEDDLETGQLA
ncbi:hypothetical protein CLAFUW4_09099 [Fulvia fulva]|nr:hypothetical protein CLAFUR4_09105 [Fulvia fulva]KAK4614758.1 hypothetical protein CLAFUR0_09097 [Fulvia fulva]WPV20800.1 hypothetical protein CLAFUW4_09099 [Fulvia fulva]WPV35291.1 hypothetical protein CLAFUW7_09100 [Fulvia fulva]